VLRLHPPIRSSVLLHPMEDSLYEDDIVTTEGDADGHPNNTDRHRRRSKGQSLSVEFELDMMQAKIIDRSKASYIAAVIKQAMADWRSCNYQLNGYKKSSQRRMNSGGSHINSRSSNDNNSSSGSSYGGVWWPVPLTEQGVNLTAVTYPKYLSMFGSPFSMPSGAVTDSPAKDAVFGSPYHSLRSSLNIRRPKIIVFSVHEEDLQVHPLQIIIFLE
jgi:hypothetical protein